MLERRVLVVSQNIELYRSIRSSIHDSLTDICRTTSAVDVLNTLVRGAYSLIIIDIPSLEKDSLELLRTIRKAKPIPILTLVEEAKPADKVALFHAGADACLEKPLDWTVCAAQADVLIQLYLELNQTHEACCPLTFGMELVISPLYRQVIITFEEKARKRRIDMVK